VWTAWRTVHSSIRRRGVMCGPVLSIWNTMQHARLVYLVARIAIGGTRRPGDVDHSTAQFILRAGQRIEYSRSTNSTLPRNVNRRSDFFLRVHSKKAYRNKGGISPLILNLGTRWRWVVNFTPRQLHLREIPQSRSIWGWVGPFPESNPGLSKPVASCYDDQATPTVSRNVNQPNNLGRKLAFFF